LSAAVSEALPSTVRIDDDCPSSSHKEALKSVVAGGAEPLGPASPATVGEGSVELNWRTYALDADNIGGLADDVAYIVQDRDATTTDVRLSNDFFKFEDTKPDCEKYRCARPAPARNGRFRDDANSVLVVSPDSPVTL
jgi:hypothetical protein